MAAKNYAITAGLLLVLLGLAGFFTTGRLLIFEVDPIHNLFHLVTGVVFVFAGFSSVGAARVWDWLIGGIYALVTILGFALAGNLVITQFNMADNWLHLLIAVTALGFGFRPATKEEAGRERARRAA